MVRRELSAIDSAIHEMFLIIFRLSHIQVLPQLSTMPKNTVGSVVACGLGVCKTTVYTPKLICLLYSIPPFPPKEHLFVIASKSWGIWCNQEPGKEYRCP
jgi:hypothetical protein